MHSFTTVIIMDVHGIIKKEIKRKTRNSIIIRGNEYPVLKLLSSPSNQYCEQDKARVRIKNTIPWVELDRAASSALHL